MTAPSAVEPDLVESELKFSASDPAPLRRLARAARLGPATLGPPTGFDEVDRYLDTADRRLGQLGWACRLRTREGHTIVSLKGPPMGGADDAHGVAFHRRPEVEGPAAPADPASWPTSAARDRLLALTDGLPLEELLALRQRRVERHVVVAGNRLGTLSLDAVRVVRAGRPIGRLNVVELELQPSAASDGALVAALHAALAGTRGLVPDPLSKLERAEAMIAALSAAGAGGR